MKTFFEKFDEEFPILSFSGKSNKCSIGLTGKFTRDDKKFPNDIKFFIKTEIEEVIKEMEKNKKQKKDWRKYYTQQATPSSICDDIYKQTLSEIQQLLKEKFEIKN